MKKEKGKKKRKYKIRKQRKIKRKQTKSKKKQKKNTFSADIKLRQETNRKMLRSKVSIPFPSQFDILKKKNYKIMKEINRKKLFSQKNRPREVLLIHWRIIYAT